MTKMAPRGPICEGRGTDEEACCGLVRRRDRVRIVAAIALNCSRATIFTCNLVKRAISTLNGPSIGRGKVQISTFRQAWPRRADIMGAMKGLLRITGTVDLSQFWPSGTSDTDTANVVVNAD